MLNIRKIRLEKNLTQKQVAQKAGIPLRTYSNYERGINKIPYDKMQDVAYVLRVDIGQLYPTYTTQQQRNSLPDNIYNDTYIYDLPSIVREPDSKYNAKKDNKRQEKADVFANVRDPKLDEFLIYQADKMEPLEFARFLNNYPMGSSKEAFELYELFMAFRKCSALGFRKAKIKLGRRILQISSKFDFEAIRFNVSSALLLESFSFDQMVAREGVSKALLESKANLEIDFEVTQWYMDIKVAHLSFLGGISPDKNWLKRNFEEMKVYNYEKLSIRNINLIYVAKLMCFDIVGKSNAYLQECQRVFEHYIGLEVVDESRVSNVVFNWFDRLFQLNRIEEAKMVLGKLSTINIIDFRLIFRREERYLKLLLANNEIKQGRVKLDNGLNSMYYSQLANYDKKNWQKLKEDLEKAEREQRNKN